MACSTYGRHEDWIQNSLPIPEGKNNSEDLNVDRKIILKFMFKNSG
jgi:hypothetical protein